MKSQIKAEFKKLLSVRSTYIISLLIIVLTSFFTYMATSRVYIEPEGLSNNSSADSKHQTSDIPSQKPLNPTFSSNLPTNKVRQNLQDSIAPISIFMAIVAILLMGHEYRYNTITYSLTLSRSRSRILGSKILVVVAYTAIMTLLAMLATVLATHLAVDIKGLNLPHQDIDWLYVIGRSLVYALGLCLIGLALITLLRNLFASAVALFLLYILNSMGGSILMSHNVDPSRFLPFSALTRLGIEGGTSPGLYVPSVPRTAVVFGIYLLAFWGITWYLFLRRDAS